MLIDVLNLGAKEIDHYLADRKDVPAAAKKRLEDLRDALDGAAVDLGGTAAGPSGQTARRQVKMVHRGAIAL